MKTRRAECPCGQLAAICAGEPVRVSVCHCLACKRRSGSAFSNNARFPEERVSFEGRSKEYTRVSDAGSRVTYSFCPECGTTVHYKIDAQPGLIAISGRCVRRSQLSGTVSLVLSQEPAQPVGRDRRGAVGKVRLRADRSD